MFGIDDVYVWTAYLLCIATTLLCVVYGLVNWKRGEDSARDEDARLAGDEKAVEE